MSDHAMHDEPIAFFWRSERLKHPIQLLNAEQQAVIESECLRLSDFCGWHRWTANARSHHVHVVIAATNYSGKRVRDQLKANCTRVLRERGSFSGNGG